MKKLLLVAGIIGLSGLNLAALEPPAPTNWEAAEYDVLWMGPMFENLENHEPWLLHGSLGWFYVGDPNSYNLWLWREGLGWIFTNWEYDPLFYSLERGWIWIHFVQNLAGAEEPNWMATGWVYNYDGDGWENLLGE